MLTPLGHLNSHWRVQDLSGFQNYLTVGRISGQESYQGRNQKVRGANDLEAPLTPAA